MGTRLSEWNIIWIIHVFTMESSEGLVSKSGNVVFKPASVVSMGSNVSIICISTSFSCNRGGDFWFLLNKTMRKPDWGNWTSATVHLFSVTESRHVVCFRECDGLKNVVHMDWLRVGYPPDPPSNIGCSLDECSPVMICKWDLGQRTGLPTNYSVLVKNLQTGQENTVRRDVANVTIPVNRTVNGTFAIQIIAANRLNHSASEVVLVQLADIVVPVTPVITKIDVLESNLVISINWRNQTSENRRYCELEYNTLREPMWTLAGEKIISNNRLSIVKIRNANSLQLRCREATGRSYWSRWSDPYVFPPAAPEDHPDVWRILGPEHPDGSQEITILIKPNPDDLPLRRVAGYKVYYLHNSIESVLRNCSPTGIQCAAVIPKGISTIFISSYNSYGISPASEIPIWEQAGSEPQKLTVTSGLLTSIPVQWQPPRYLGGLLQAFILQWSPDSCDGKQRNISWQKLGKEETSFTINDNMVAGDMVTISVYAVYSSGVIRLSTTYGYSQELKPKKGPRSKLDKDSSDARSIRWDEIPLCDRRGFITEYTLYLKPESSRVQTKGSSRHFVLERLNSSELYSVCISASTSAGEGPADHCTLIHPDNSLHNYLGLLFGIGFGTITLTVLFLTVSPIRKRLKTVIIFFLPKYLREEYPRADNSEAVKALQADREDLETTSYPTYSDPEITEVQDASSYPVPMAEAVEERVAADEPLLNFPTSDDFPEHTLGYRPQLTEAKIQRNDSYYSPTHMLDIQRVAQRSESPTLALDTEENTVLWDTGAEMDLQFFKAIKLLLGDGTDPNKESYSLQATASNCTERLHRETSAEMQEVPTDRLICTLQSGPKEYNDVHSYFPQMFAKGK